MKLPPMTGRTMKAKATAILLMAISTCATAAESLSQADATFVAEYDRLSQAIDNLCAIWERDLHKPERLTGPVLKALIELLKKHDNDLDLACSATYLEEMRTFEQDRDRER
jgi:hypothetical protein